MIGREMEVYLDNAATTRCSERAMERMIKMLTEEYGNPSSLHNMGKRAEDAVRRAGEQIAKTLKVSGKEIVFTSGGTEANNMALTGAAFANMRAGKHIITTEAEHASVHAPLEFLREHGFEITCLGVDRDGRISPEELADVVRADTILVSVMMVNNEPGAVGPVAEAAAIVHSKSPAALFHVDAIQAYGKYRIFPKKTGIDLLSVSGHKIHAPKGTGFLYVREKAKVKPLILGGGQQKGMRSGTENVPGAAALGEAAQECYEDFERKTEQMYALKERLISGLAQTEGVSVNGRTGREAAPHIISITVDGVRSEVMLHALEEHGIYVSAGSACSSNKSARPSASRTLRGMGLTQQAQESTIRVSLSSYTSETEIDYALEKMREIIPRLRRYIRR